MLNSRDGFNLQTNDRDPAGTFASAPPLLGNAQCPTIVDDASTGDLYLFLN